MLGPPLGLERQETARIRYGLPLSTDKIGPQKNIVAFEVMPIQYSNHSMELWDIRHAEMEELELRFCSTTDTVKSAFCLWKGLVLSVVHTELLRNGRNVEGHRVNG